MILVWKVMWFDCRCGGGFDWGKYRKGIVVIRGNFYRFFV